MGKANIVFEDVYYGRRPNLYDLLDLAKHLHDLGLRGEEIHKLAVEDEQTEAVKQDVIKGLRFLETTSRHLQEVAEKAGFPTKDTPVYINSMVYKQVDAPPSYEEIVAEVEA
jgi:hypothetical protein